MMLSAREAKLLATVMAIHCTECLTDREAWDVIDEANAAARKLLLDWRPAKFLPRLKGLPRERPLQLQSSYGSDPPILILAILSFTGADMSLAGIKATTTIGGLKFPDNVDIVSEGVVLTQKSITYGVLNVWAPLSTRTSDTVGTITFPGTPPVTTGQVVDLYFATGVRYGVTIGTVSGSAAPFSGGIGDALPVATSQMLARAAEVKALLFPQDSAAIIKFGYAPNIVTDALTAIYGTGRATIRLLTSGDVEIVRRTIEDGYSYQWTDGSGETDPTAGQAVAKVSISHSYGTGLSSQKTVQVGVAYN